MVLGHSRLIWARYVVHQDLATVLRCHVAAFEAFGGAPREILYDRMKTAVTGEGERDGIVYNTVANPRVHATTRRVVNEAFAEEKLHLRPLPLAPFRAVLRLERRISRDGMVSVGGNLYSVPDTTRRRVFDVHVLADEIRIFENGQLVASHLPLEGRGEKRLDPGHRKLGGFSRRRASSSEPATLTRAGDHAPRRSLDFYAAVGRRLAARGAVR
jgi:hypothetical protein